MAVTMKHGHKVDGVSACPTRVRHAVLRVPFKKYYLSTQTRVGHNKIWLEHAPDRAWTRVEHDWTLLGYGQNTT